jgi:hypothetical protein
MEPRASKILVVSLLSTCATKAPYALMTLEQKWSEQCLCDAFISCCRCHSLDACLGRAGARVVRSVAGGGGAVLKLVTWYVHVVTSSEYFLTELVVQN